MKKMRLPEIRKAMIEQRVRAQDDDNIGWKLVAITAITALAAIVVFMLILVCFFAIG